MMKAQTPEFRPPIRQNENQRRIVWIVVLLLIGVEIPEMPTYIAYFFPYIKTEQRNWFIHYDMKMAEYWYYKFSCERIAWILRMIAFTKTAVQYSTTVFLASILILSYLIWDFAMFWYNYNTWVYAYEFMILFIYFTGKSLIKPFKPDSFARIRSLF